jgi:hypothetical protein
MTQRKLTTISLIFVLIAALSAAMISGCIDQKYVTSSGGGGGGGGGNQTQNATNNTTNVTDAANNTTDAANNTTGESDPGGRSNRTETN